MPTTTTTGTLFKPELIREMFSKVKGHSSLAKLCNASPMPFAGSEIFVFSMDGEASIVGEGAAKPAGEVVCRALDSLTGSGNVVQGTESIGAYSLTATYLNAGQSLYFLKSELKLLGLKRQTYGALNLYQAGD